MDFLLYHSNWSLSGGVLRGEEKIIWYWFIEVKEEEPDTKWIDDAWSEYISHTAMTPETMKLDREKFKKSILSHMPR